MLEKFKNIVDEVKTQFDSEIIEYTSGSRNYKHFYKNINDLLSPDSEIETIDYKDFFKIYNELIFRYVLYEEDPKTYIITLDIIRDAINSKTGEIPSLKNLEIWKEVIRHSLDHQKDSTTFDFQLINIKNKNPRAYDKAITAKELIQYGCDISIKNSDFSINSGLDKIIIEIENLIEKIGGETLINSLFNHLYKINRYSVEFERFFLSRHVPMLSNNQRPSIPYGYLLNLGLKYISSNLTCKSKQIQKSLDRILKLSILISKTIYDVQPYSVWDLQFHNNHTIIDFIQELALFDSIFTIIQEKPKSAIESLIGILHNLDVRAIESSLGISIEELSHILNYISNIGTRKLSCNSVYYSEIVKEFKNIEKEKLKKLLDILSISSNYVNKEYKLPSHYDKIDFIFTPLIKISGTKFILPEKSWSAPNFYEAIANYLRNNGYNNFDNEVGLAIEKYIYKILSDKGITYFNGDYFNESEKGEVDLVIETSKSIILFEFKKKTLTRKSKSGIDINLFIDLSKSLLKSQIQLTKSEILLRKNGHLTLKNKKGDVKELKLNDRIIEKISLTQLDFGAFQDRIILEQFMESILVTNFEADSPDDSIIKDFNKMNIMFDVVRNQYQQLDKLKPRHNHLPYFDNWFLSLPHLKTLLENCSDNDSFYEELKKNKFVTYNTLDFYYEYQLNKAR